MSRVIARRLNVHYDEIYYQDCILSEPIGLTRLLEFISNFPAGDVAHRLCESERNGDLCRPR